MGERRSSEDGSAKPCLLTPRQLLCAGCVMLWLAALAAHLSDRDGPLGCSWKGGSALHFASAAWRQPVDGGGGGERQRHQRSHPPTMHPSAPRREMFYAMQADPAVSGSTAALEEFAAAPWLLPPRTPALPYAGVHRLDQLMALRSAPAGRHRRSIAVLLFSKAYAVMAQNSIYSLVKHSGVRNYLAVTWAREDFEACLDLNLPCADVSGLLLEPLASSSRQLQHDFVVMTWIKPAVVLAALRQGYAVMSVDTDISYAVKPLWESYLELIEQNDADGAWQAEGPINAGHFVLLPTNASLAFAEAWAGAGPASVPQKVTEQKALAGLAGSHFVACRSLCLCYRRKFELIEQGRRDRVAVFATYLPSHFPYSLMGCTAGSQEWVPHVDPCDWGVLYLHPICALGAAVKEGIIREAGFWFMDSRDGCPAQPDAKSGVPACRPLHWQQPGAEAAHYGCPSFGLGLVHGRLPAAAQALRDGASGEEAQRLLQLSADRECNGRGEAQQQQGQQQRQRLL